jgi:hypothetical protein
VSTQRACGVALALALGGCGLNVQSPDLFLLTRVGAGGRLTLLVNDGGTIRCNGGSPRALPDPLLLEARDLATRLNDDAKRGLRIPRARHSVATYTVKLQHGVVSFPDNAAGAHSELAQLELFVVRAAQGPCRLGG